ncbi:hypothetical protein DIPPA_24783 [Diplonema papillatum]|nr:hypothetical protein DIPPA_24783 [Diplonema papillatum]
MNSADIEAPSAVERQIQGFLAKDLEAINSVSAARIPESELTGAIGKQMMLFGEGTVCCSLVPGSVVGNRCLVHVVQEGGLGMEDFVSCMRVDGQWRVDEWGQDGPEEDDED